MKNALIVLFLLMLLGCSNRVLVKSYEDRQVKFPDINSIEYKEFNGTTYRDLVEYTLNIQNDLKQCISNLNTIKEWYKNE